MHCSLCGKHLYPRDAKTFLQPNSITGQQKALRMHKYCYLSYKNEKKKEATGESDGSDDIL